MSSFLPSSTRRASLGVTADRRRTSLSVDRPASEVETPAERRSSWMPRLMTRRSSTDTRRASVSGREDPAARRFSWMPRFSTRRSVVANPSAEPSSSLESDFAEVDAQGLPLAEATFVDREGDDVDHDDNIPMLFPDSPVKAKYVPQSEEIDILIVETDPSKLEHLPEGRANKQVVLAAVSRDGFTLQFASAALRADKEVVLAAVSQDASALQFASRALRADKEVVLAAVSKDASALQFASRALRADKEIVLAVVSKDASMLQFLPHEMQGDKEVIMTAIHAPNGSSAIRFAEENLRDDEDIILAATRRDPNNFKYASETLRNSIPFFKKVLKFPNGFIAFEYLSDGLKHDHAFVYKVVKKYPDVVAFASPAIQNDDKIMAYAVTLNPYLVRYASDRLQGYEIFKNIKEKQRIEREVANKLRLASMRKHWINGGRRPLAVKSTRRRLDKRRYTKKTRAV